MSKQKTLLISHLSSPREKDENIRVLTQKKALGVKMENHVFLIKTHGSSKVS